MSGTLRIGEQQIAGDDAALNLASGPASGPPLLFLHGVGRCWQDFLSLMPMIGWRWQVHGIDFRGHGRSGRAAGRYLVRDYVRDAVAAVEQQMTEPVVLFGHSLGAMVAAATAAALPGRVRGVVLEDPPFGMLGSEIRSTPYYSLFQVMRQSSGLDLSVAELARQLGESKIVVPQRAVEVRLADIRDASALRFGAACLKNVDPELWDPLVEGRWMEGYDRHAILAKIECPVLLLQGKTADGGMLDDASATEVERLVKDCTRVQVPRAGHLIHSLQSELTLRLVNGFLESLTLGGAA